MLLRLSKDKHLIKEILDSCLINYGAEYIETDPVMFVHKYSDNGDKEVIGLISALMAIGNVKQIQRSLIKLLSLLGRHPSRILLEDNDIIRKIREENIYHRFFNSGMIAGFMASIRDVIKKYGGLRELFIPRLSKLGIREGIKEVSYEFYSAALGYSNDEKVIRLLFVNPDKGSACKRWMLYLRWMVRPADGIDLGLWKSLSTSELIIPVDIHIYHISRALGLTKRNSINWGTAEEITNSLKLFDPDDPVKYDFSLTRLDMFYPVFSKKSKMELKKGVRGFWKK